MADTGTAPTGTEDEDHTLGEAYQVGTGTKAWLATSEVAPAGMAPGLEDRISLNNWSEVSGGFPASQGPRHQVATSHTFMLGASSNHAGDMQAGNQESTHRGLESLGGTSASSMHLGGFQSTRVLDRDIMSRAHSPFWGADPEPP